MFAHDGCQSRRSPAIVISDSITANEGKPTMYPKARLDALSDGIFAVAMTLLVLDVRLPDDFAPHDAHDLLRGLLALGSKFLPYVLSFGVLGLRWLSNIHLRSRDEEVGRQYTEWWLVYHLLITGVPFTTMVVGRFASLAPSIWLYAGNTMLIAAVSFRMLALTPSFERTDHLSDRKIALGLLIISSALAIAWSFIDSSQALWALALNAAALPLGHLMGRVRRARHHG
jgi:uncharacterized membrane protein